MHYACTKSQLDYKVRACWIGHIASYCTHRRKNMIPTSPPTTTTSTVMSTPATADLLSPTRPFVSSPALADAVPFDTGAALALVPALLGARCSSTLYKLMAVGAKPAERSFPSALSKIPCWGGRERSDHRRWRTTARNHTSSLSSTLRAPLSSSPFLTFTQRPWRPHLPALLRFYTPTLSRRFHSPSAAGPRSAA